MKLLSWFNRVDHAHFPSTVSCMLSCSIEKQYWTGHSSKNRHMEREHKTSNSRSPVFSIIKTSSLSDFGEGSSLRVCRVDRVPGWRASLKWWGRGGTERSREPETGNREAAPVMSSAAVFNIATVALSCKMCLGRQQNPCCWYIHQSGPDNPRSRHATVRWPIYFKSGVFPQTLVPGPGSIK